MKKKKKPKLLLSVLEELKSKKKKKISNWNKTMAMGVLQCTNYSHFLKASTFCLELHVNL